MKQIKILLFIFCNILLLQSCEFKHHNKKHHSVYKTTDKPGYCYYDNGYWWIYYMNPNRTYYFYGSSADYTYYDNSNAVFWSPSSENVSNYNEVPQSETFNMSEESGQDVGGTDADNSEDGSGMSEDSGSDSGGSDGGGSDGGGGGE